MSKRRPAHCNRRQFLKGLSAAAAAGAVATLSPKGAVAPVMAQEGSSQDQTTFLIVLTANGGASMIDATMAIRASETQNPETLNCFEDDLVQDIAGSPFRAVDLDRASLGQIPASFQARQSQFVRAHHRDMMVATWERTSVNHFIGQRRAVTGNEAWRGRTIQEIQALTHGEGFALPNVHLTTGSGFTQRGSDDTLPARAFAEVIADPALWPLALDGLKGTGAPVSRAMLARARALRNQRLDPASEFVRVMGQARRLKHWRHIRGGPQQAIEAGDLISKLMLREDSSAYPLSAYGLESSQAAARVKEVFSSYQTDPLDAQAALAFLLLKYRLSVSVTLGPNFDVVVDPSSDQGGGALPSGTLFNPPIAFDFSHQGHRSVQAFMWQRMYRVADGLIGLLKQEPYGSNGQSLWDRTMLYVATDFGRTKTRPANAQEFATAHDLNNAALVVSPLVRGNTLLGGVDPQTGQTYGFDPQTGTPDLGRRMSEREIFGGLVHALGVDSGGALPDMPIMRA